MQLQLEAAPNNPYAICIANFVNKFWLRMPKQENVLGHHNCFR